MPKRDRISWNATILGYFENSEVLEGLRLFFMMHELSVDPDLITMTNVASACEHLGDDVSVNNSLIHMCTGLGHLEEAEKVFSRMELKDVVSWTTMIASYDHHKLPYKAVVTYKMMELEGVLPDEITLVGVLSACACLGHLDLGIRLHEIAIKIGLISHVIVSNSLVDVYSKALEVFHNISGKNVVSWTSLILGLRINNRSFEALFFFRQMNESTKPNSVTLITVLSACARIGALKEIHAHALRTGIEFEGFLPNAILDMYVRCGRQVPALNQFNTQKKDVTAWNILLTGYAEQVLKCHH